MFMSMFMFMWLYRVNDILVIINLSYMFLIIK